MNNKKSCLVIGAGWMAQEYLKAARYISNLQMSFYAPSEKNKLNIESLGGLFFVDLKTAIRTVQPTHIIVASSVDSLSAMTQNMLDMGFENILVEKPAYLNNAEAEAIVSKIRTQSVYVAYNRRYYASAAKAMQLIEQNNEKIVGVQFEFTELSSDIEKNEKFSDMVKSHWALANSSHVIDFAFFPIGLPQKSKLSCYQCGHLDWHKTAAQMVGSGLSQKGVPFCYSAYWGGVGRWSVDWITDKTRYVFKPMEKLQIQKIGQFSYEEVSLSWPYEGVKHGLVEQLEAFICGNKAQHLLTLQQSVELHHIVALMAGYKD